MDKTQRKRSIQKDHPQRSDILHFSDQKISDLFQYCGQPYSKNETTEESDLNKNNIQSNQKSETEKE